jgi:hypothetical protein
MRGGLGGHYKPKKPQERGNLATNLHVEISRPSRMMTREIATASGGMLSTPGRHVTLGVRVAESNEGGLGGHCKPQETTGTRAVGPLRCCRGHGKNSRMMTGDRKLRLPVEEQHQLQ